MLNNTVKVWMHHLYLIQCCLIRNYALRVFVPNVKPRDAKHTVGIIYISYLNREHILNVCIEAYDIFPIYNAHFYPDFFF